MTNQEKELLKKSADAMGILLDEKALERFGTYMTLLLEWNEKMNLTAITEPTEVVQKHFADCLTVLGALPKEKGIRVIDVGTGAGFPGLPVKIAREDVDLTLLDSLQKRIHFLETVCDALDTEKVCCIHKRAEDGGQDAQFREQFDCCVSRAVARLSVLAEYCLPFVKVGGRLIALKGPDAKTEAEEAKKAVSLLGGKIVEVLPVQVPFTDLHHTLVIVEKQKHTPKQYPRKAGKISKEPLQ